MGRQKTPLSRQLADIDLKLLRIFKSVVDAGGFSAAESTLNISTSSISNYMSDLEKRLDMRLCTRGRAGFSLTEHGRVVYDATLELLDALDQFRDRINSSHDQLLGDLHLGIAEQLLYLPNNGLVESLREFHLAAPGVRLHLQTLTAEEIPPAVADGSLHAGISVLHGDQPPQLEIEALYDEQMLLYCGRGHPLFGAKATKAALQQLNQCNFIESTKMRSGQQFDPMMEQWNKQASTLQQEARLTLLLTGQFVGYIPVHLAQQEPWSQELYPLFPERLGYRNSYNLMIRPQHRDNRIVALFRKLLLEQTNPQRTSIHPM